VTWVLNVLLSLTPVVAYLAALVYMDSYKLVPVRKVAITIAAGGLVALACLLANQALLDASGIRFDLFTRYVAPVVEETGKGLIVVVLIRSRRIGFLVDAAIHGFAAGAGFALVENVFYLGTLADATTLLYLIRGFGTAILHGSTTALFAILSRGLLGRHGERPAWFLPPLAAAILVHSLFNHFVVPPLVMTLAQLAILPLLLVLVFERSERATRRWLGVGFDTDVELLEMIDTGRFPETRLGRYLETLRGQFPGLVVADMLCLLQVHLELSIRAKGILLARKAGIDVPVDEEVRANLKELAFLERSVGKTGRLALAPVRHTGSRELWQLTMLGGSARHVRQTHY